jgi:hypothetical protein
VITITDRDDVQEGDRVYYGCLGYFHDGTARTIEDGDGSLSVNRGGNWYADFIRAERPE